MEEAMDEYLEEVLDIDNADVRTRIIHEGYRSLDVLVKKDKVWVRSLRLSIKKAPNAAARDITLEHEEGLVKTLLWAKLRYITQRPLTYADATADSITEVYDWYNAQEEELSIDTVSTFSHTLNRRDLLSTGGIGLNPSRAT
jgi:hypothetical protein